MVLEKNVLLDKKNSKINAVFNFCVLAVIKSSMYYVLYVTCTLFLSYYIKVFTIGKKYSMQNKLN